jgi:hypothetical protein
MDLGPGYRFEIRRCPSRLGITWRWLVFKNRTLITTGVVLARDRSSAEAAAKAALEKSRTPDLLLFRAASLLHVPQRSLGTLRHTRVIPRRRILLCTSTFARRFHCSGVVVSAHHVHGSAESIRNSLLAVAS